MCLPATVVSLWTLYNRTLSALVPVVDVGLRFWIAKVFFMSGWTKIQSWSSTLMLFEYEYEVPLLPYDVAAWSGTAVELIAPVFLLLGLGGRVPATVLFFFNIMAVWAYPFLWTEDGAIGFYQHLVWGVVLAVLMCYGTQALSIDRMYACYRSRH